MKILLTGKNGQVGWELQRALAPLGEVIACDRSELDLANPDQIAAMVRETKPQIIVNAAAYTAVDKAESDYAAAFAVNAHAPEILAREAKHLGAILVHYSTDYVFDGKKRTPWLETDLPNPLNAYGRSKLAGEQAIQASGAAHIILRTSWVYGLHGQNFLLTMLRLGKERDELRIVDDQVGAPTWSRSLARATAQLLSRALANSSEAREDLRGLYHLTARGQTSWFGFAEQIFSIRRLLGHAKTPKLSPIPSSAYPLPATRPNYSILSGALISQDWQISLPEWQASLSECLKNLAPKS